MSAAERLKQCLHANGELLAREQAFSKPEVLAELRRWQALRLYRTYPKLTRQDQFALAAEFFRDDLYGDGDFSQRDQDVARIYPAMVRLLPRGVLDTVADAAELQVLTRRFDLAMAEQLQAGWKPDDYAAAYQSVNDRSARDRQIQLMLAIGRNLERIVRLPLVRGALRLARGPAHAAGLGQLQDFLERGLAAFATMDDVDLFIATIAEREQALSDVLLDSGQWPKNYPVGNNPDSA